MSKTPTKPTLKLLSAARGSNINYEVFWTSEPYKIGKTYWINVLYYCNIYKKFFTGYHFHEPNFNRSFPCDEWKTEENHKNYNHHDGTYAGLPKGLIKLWKKNEKFTKSVCASKTKEEGIEIIKEFENKQKQESLF
ncbi:MAG: hypothetical protein ACTJGM_09355 [Fusobacterium sp.]